ncbi:hypothetical protein SNOG_09631 [Parastagonospora nodorum SN15]|uniref:Uncharacterized protein n=1 Tax=Phaeosphaeria nodorum (strain SN15 / ATCC MYA-4574 / FGSC 10173) TaxID=321614 RepID=Q0UF33_PHANO|nr:hypothetical protein SNOG_09631 [Parastagonospora nodorum SN15]EAT82896.1 hypothetical protein SNOG_09631 [Parastagonospora nodorum SN15]
MEGNSTLHERSDSNANIPSGWTPANGIAESGAATSPPDTGSSEPPAKRRREERERTREENEMFWPMPMRALLKIRATMRVHCIVHKRPSAIGHCG